MMNTPIKRKIGEALTRAGLPEVPTDAHASLSDYGLDSLVMVLSIIEFEKLFNIKIPAKEFTPEAFATMESLEEFLKKRGVS